MANERKSLFHFGYRRSPDQDTAKPARHTVVIVGAGPVGLSMAIDLAQRGVPSVLLDDADRIGEGSRGLCYSKRALEIWDRLGVGEKLVEMGVTWKLGKVYLGDRMVYSFDLLPEDGHKMPAFINLQQYYTEAFLVDRAKELPQIDLRWCNKVVGLRQRNDHVLLAIDTPDGSYRLKADFVIACDGARSALRGFVGAEFAGEVFEDQFLIADVKMTAEFPTERWFWFDPPFHDGQSALLHRQPDDVWRIDLQLGPGADPAIERRPENVRPRIARMLGHDQFEFEWISIYKFQCRRMQRFVHERVIFAGDAAHQVSPFGARGANSGLEDGENLAWKLSMILRGEAPLALLDSYEIERAAAADENIRASTCSTDFIAPHSRQERRMRQAVLRLAGEVEFAKRMVNGGRLSTPSVYRSPLSTDDVDAWVGGPRPGAHMIDAPLTTADGKPIYLTDAVKAARGGFVLLQAGEGISISVPDCCSIGIGGAAPLRDASGLFAKRYDAASGAAYLLRPDGYVAARFRHPTRPAVEAAVARACARTGAAA